MISNDKGQGGRGEKDARIILFCPNLYLVKYFYPKVRFEPSTMRIANIPTSSVCVMF